MALLQGTKALEKWCRIVTEGYDAVNIVNMTTSWRSGLGFCAIIHHFRPELLDFDSLDEEDVLGNNQLAFSTAEQHLGIPALLDPQDMVECELLDRLSILTYLSQFYQAFHGATTAASAPKPARTPSSRSAASSPAKTLPRMPVVAGKGTEPCKICGKPVFILERLNVGGKLLHRTCFKCARCGAQLNIVSYYETESGDYCCDVCPDEEKTQEAVVEANKKMVQEHLDSGVEGSSEDEDEEEKEAEKKPQEESEVAVESAAESKPEEVPRIYPDITASVEDKGSEEAEAKVSDESPIEASSAKEDLENKSDKESKTEEFEEVRPDANVSEAKDTEAVEEHTDDANNNEKKKVVVQAEANPFDDDDEDVKTDIQREAINQKQVEEPTTDTNPFACSDDEAEDVKEIVNDPQTEEKEEGSKGSVPEIKIAETSDLADNDESDPKEESYPTDMNPFGDDDEGDEVTEPKEALETEGATKKADTSTNPFGSDLSDEEDDSEQAEVVLRKVPNAQSTPVVTASPPPKPPRVPSVVGASTSLNPFGSDFEDEDDDLKTTPLRLPPSPTPSSASSIRSGRKKRQAPQPPGKSSPAARRSLQPTPAPRSGISTPNSSFRESSPFNSAKSARFRPAPPRPPPPSSSELHKQRKERDNLNRRSQLMETSSIASTSTSDPQQNGIVLTPLSPDKASAEGQWKKKKGPAPPRPIPQKRQVRKIPRKAVNTELHDIEIKQQELERQGVKLEKTIRECCEKNDQERTEQGLENIDRDSLGPEVEDLIIQLFDLVNEKNDLFRRQTELMYMKRDFRLEEEHADIEHQIRVLMNKPESQKTPEDVSSEEKLIARLMEIVSQRNEIVDCLEMDRLRELEEDESFETHMGEYAAIKPTEDDGLKKKLKKKKEKKKKKKDKNFDADKDIDTSEHPHGSPKASPKKVGSEKDKAKKLKKKILNSIMATSLKKTKQTPEDASK